MPKIQKDFAKNVSIGPMREKSVVFKWENESL